MRNESMKDIIGIGLDGHIYWRNKGREIIREKIGWDRICGEDGWLGARKKLAEIEHDMTVYGLEKSIRWRNDRPGGGNRRAREAMRQCGYRFR
jgi:hypothetical protein